MRRSGKKRAGGERWCCCVYRRAGRQWVLALRHPRCPSHGTGGVWKAVLERRAVAAGADAALDVFFPRLGPCGVCGVRGLDQRHRVVEAIAGMLAAGEDLDVVAEEYGVTAGAVAAVAEWAAKWPGAWQ